MMRVLVTGGTGYLGSELVAGRADGVSTRDFDVPHAPLRTWLSNVREVLT
jgi:nucleoside-diphosphate-sugar epimerase